MFYLRNVSIVVGMLGEPQISEVSLVLFDLAARIMIFGLSADVFRSIAPRPVHLSPPLEGSVARRASPLAGAALQTALRPSARTAIEPLLSSRVCKLNRPPFLSTGAIVRVRHPREDAVTRFGVTLYPPSIAVTLSGSQIFL